MSDSYQRARDDAFRQDEARRQEQDQRDRRRAWDDQDRRSRERSSAPNANSQSSGSVTFEEPREEGLLEQPVTTPGTTRTNFGKAFVGFGVLGVVLNIAAVVPTNSLALSIGLLVAGVGLVASGRSAARRSAG